MKRITDWLKKGYALCKQLYICTRSYLEQFHRCPMWLVNIMIYSFILSGFIAYRHTQSLSSLETIARMSFMLIFLRTSFWIIAFLLSVVDVLGGCWRARHKANNNQQ